MGSSLHFTLLALIATLPAMAWVYSRRRQYRATGRPLTPDEHAVLVPYFGSRLLLSVLIAEVDRIEDSFLVRWLRAVGWKRVPGGLEWVFGMAFVDAVALKAAAAHREQRKMPLLFHELVHIAQYQQVGTATFLMRYIRGWLSNGMVYMAIPIEQEAYALQDRFASGEVFEVARELQTPG